MSVGAIMLIRIFIYLVGCGEISQYERCYLRPKLWKIQTSLTFYRF